MKNDKELEKKNTISVWLPHGQIHVSLYIPNEFKASINAELFRFHKSVIPICTKKKKKKSVIPISHNILSPSTHYTYEYKENSIREQN